MIEKVEGREFDVQPLTGDESNGEPELYNGGLGEAARAEKEPEDQDVRPDSGRRGGWTGPSPAKSSGLRRI